jgi:invasion protein IalB
LRCLTFAGRATHAFFVAISALTFCAVVPEVLAQTDATPRLSFSPWVKLCDKDADPKAKRVCVTVNDGRAELGDLVVSVAIIETDGEPKKLLRMSLPYGVNLQYGARLIVDQGKPATASFVTCLPPAVPPGGCIADYDATADLINQMKKGQLLTVQAIHMKGQAVSPPAGTEGLRRRL